MGEIPEFMRRFADRLDDPVCIVALTGETRYVNAPFLACLGSAAIDAVFPDDRAAWLEALPAGEAISTRALPGRETWAVVRWDFVPMEGGLVAAIAHDASPIRSVQADSLLASIVSSSDDAIVSKTLDGIVTSWNRAAERMFGYSAAEMVGSSILKIFPEDRRHEETRFRETLRGGGQVERFRTLRHHKDGTPIEVSVTIAPLFDRAGNVVGASKIVRDISLSAREAHASASLAAIVESSDDAIVSKTLQSIVTTWNPGAERIFGYSAEEMIGQPILKIIPDDRKNEEDVILARLRNGERVDHFETVRRTKDGRLIDVSVTVSPIRNLSGEIVGASKVARVITERKLAEVALQESERHLRGLTELLEKRVQDRTADLQAALREMEGFTYTISHDLRTPLRAIIANCRLMEEDFGDQIPAQAHRLLQRQSDAALRLATLIDDLLRLSRIGRQALQKVEVDLSGMAQDVVAELMERSPQATFVVTPNLRVQADPLLLRLAITNLFENATKFVRPGVPPVVEFGAEGDVFFVRDNGIGFEPTYAERIFLPFERLHRDVDYPGTGIGLANVRRIVERHGGTVWATAHQGQGAIFSFRLPAEA